MNEPKPDSSSPLPEASSPTPPEIADTPLNREGDGMNVSQVHGSILREQSDPADGYEPIPLWLVTFIMIVVFWSGLYLAYNSGGFESDIFDPSLVSWRGGVQQAETGPPDPMVLGRRLFAQNCVVCHQSTGLGVAGQFPPLAGSEWVVSTDWHGDNHLVKILLHGLQGPVTVMGNLYNNAMPAQNLSDAQISAVLTYIRNEWGNAASPISEEYVAQLRTETEGRREPWTQSELQAIPAAMDEGGPATDAPADAPPADAPAEDSSDSSAQKKLENPPASS